MIPNLLEATTNYWQELNKVEAAYRSGELSLEEVDARVKALMTTLGHERRAAFTACWYGLRHLWQEQREALLGIGVLGTLTYVWVAFNQLS